MVKKIYVGGLAYASTDATLREFFAQSGTVKTVSIVMDRETGRSKGFGFVEMSTDDEATAAINALNGKQLDGRTLTVNEAKPRTDRPMGNNNRNRFGSRSF